MILLVVGYHQQRNHSILTKILTLLAKLVVATSCLACACWALAHELAATAAAFLTRDSQAEECVVCQEEKKEE